MNVENIIHPVKRFTDLGDGDVTSFLRDRKFESDTSTIEFKSDFPDDGGKSGREIFKPIVGLLNAEGGVIVYGVSDRINDASVPFPEYILGLTEYPSPEKFDQLAKERISPSVDLRPMRVFDVAGRKVAIIRVPPGDNKPYCYYDPRSRGVWYFKRAGATTYSLAPSEVREFYAKAVVEQAARFLRSGEFSQQLATTQAANRKRRIKAHQKMIKPLLENIRDFGFVGMYTLPAQTVSIPWNSLSDFLTKHRFDFSEEMRLSQGSEPFQNAVSAGFFPRAVRADIKSTYRITIYQDGLVALDSQADDLMGKDDEKNLNPFWLSYEVQRHLQMSRALLEGSVDLIHVVLELENVQDFHMSTQDYGFGGLRASRYAGSHQPIERETAIRDIHPHDGDKRNIVMLVVEDIMAEVSRIFGYSKAPHGLWDQSGYLNYVKGLENSR